MSDIQIPPAQLELAVRGAEQYVNMRDLLGQLRACRDASADPVAKATFDEFREWLLSCREK